MNDRTESLQFDEVKRRLRPGDVFQSTEHDWKTQKEGKWVGTCPWHDSNSGTCFKVFEPSELKWKCHSCGRGGGPLKYVAELKGVGSGARGSLKGKDFFRAWEALARHAGCEGPPDFDSEESGTRSGARSDRKRRRPRKAAGKRVEAPRRVESASTTSEGAGMSRDIKGQRPPRGQPEKPTLDTPEAKLREALSRYRDALKESDKARAYARGRGLSVGTLYRHGCGFAPAGEWIGQDNAPRLVTPHTTAPRDSSSDGRPRLVNLDGRYVGGGDVRRYDRIGGNPTALFNASAIGGDSFAPAEPLVICEGPFDALSFIEAGHARTIATHGKKAPPWEPLRGAAETLVFAFDRDDEDAKEKAIGFRGEAYWSGFDAHTLHDEPAYEGHEDPNDALQAGDLSLDYLRELEGEETAAKSSDPEADRSPTPQNAGREAAGDEPTAAELVPYWDGDNIGYLGRWLWERGGVPDGDVGGGVYADRELHEWIKAQLEAGPQGTSEETQIRLRWVLWRLYAAHGPEEVPEWQIPIPPMRRA